MSREIKFRAWMVKEKAMRFWDSIITWQTAIDIFVRKDVITMQYTGLKDKNRKEIYEGDVIEFGIKKTEFVRYSPNFAGFYPFCLEHYWHSYALLPKDCKVIGNIYEHPELLKEGK